MKMRIYLDDLDCPGRFIMLLKLTYFAQFSLSIHDSNVQML